MIPRVFLLLIAAVALGQGQAPPPLGLDLYRPVPEDNLLTNEKVALGRRLFFDKRLSRDRSLACSSCHDPKRAFTDAKVVAVGVGGRAGTRNVPTLVNRVWGKRFFLDGRSMTLEAQALEPIANPLEMDLPVDQIKARVGLEPEQVARALASYVRTILSGNADYDKYLNGKESALSKEAKAGLAIFRGKGLCTACHTGPNLTDEQFHNTGVAYRDGVLLDEGRYKRSGLPEDRGAFKVPTLRDIDRTAPYMHDGSLARLEDVVEFYDRGGTENPGLDPVVRPLNLTAEEKRSVVEFLRSLSGTIREGKI